MKINCAMKRLCIYIRWVASILLLPVVISHSFAQIEISGVVTDSEDKTTLVGVNIMVQGTTSGTITDFDGGYTLSIPSSDAVLVVSYTGYESQEITVGTQTVINIALSPSTATLEEVVVVGYGTQKKSNVSGSIVSVGAEDLEKVQSPSFDAALQGKVPGVYVTTNGGQPGGGVFVRIRGAGAINNSNPLYVIDGVIVGAGNNENSNPLVTINPNDIASIDILKDAASTAIYGARAANGVVLITTKRGAAGKPRISYNTYVGLQEPVADIPRPMNAMEFAENMNRAFTAAGQEAPFSNPSSLGEGTNWVDEVLNNGWITDHQLSVTGGGEKNQYYLSLNYFENQGVMLETFQRRYSIRANTDNQITNAIKVGNSLSYSRGSRFDNGAGNRTFIHGTFTNLYQSLPTIPVYDETTSTGFGGPTDTRLERRGNLVSAWSLPTRKNPTDRILGNAYLEIAPPQIKGLTLRTSFSADIINSSSYFYRPSKEEGLDILGTSQINQGRNNSIFWLWENTASYARSIGKNNVVLTAGTSAQEFEGTSFNASATYGTDVFTEIVTGAQTLTTTSSSTEESLASIFGRLTYDFANKYLLTAAIRRDGSSKFGPNNKFGVFPSFTVGWRVSHESFFNPGFLTDLKIRGGWGQVGSDAIGNFRYLATLSTDFDYAFGNQANTSTLGAALEDLANPNVQWETSTEYNLGFDAGFMDGRLTLSAEYFNRSRTDMLFVFPLAGVSGLNSTVDNVGELVNRGFEFAAGYRKVTGDFQYDFNANLSTFDSEVVDLGGREQIVAFNYAGSGATVVIRKGQPLGVFLARRTEGLFQTQAEVDAANGIDGEPSTPYQQVGTAPGDFKWKDINGDGKVDNNDKEIVGSPIPSFTYGFGGNMSYRRYDMSFQFFGVYGNDIFNIARSQLESSGRAYNKSSTTVNAWNGPGSSNSIPRPHVGDPNQNILLGDHLIEDGSYLRLRNLQIGYNVPKSVLDSLKLSNFRLYLAAQNLFVITSFSGIDPEVGFDQNSSAVGGIYQDLYPQVRSWSFGLNVGF